MNRILLENGIGYFVVIKCEYDKKTYLYLINEVDDSDIKIVELTINNTIKYIEDTNLIKMIMDKMVSYIYRFYD